MRRSDSHHSLSNHHKNVEEESSWEKGSFIPEQFLKQNDFQYLLDFASSLGLQRNRANTIRRRVIQFLFCHQLLLGKLGISFNTISEEECELGDQ